MNKTIYYVCVIISLFGVACTSEHNEHTDFQISFDSNPMLKLSQIADSVKIIELQENDTCILGRVSRIQLYKEHLYIDDYKTKAVYRYTLDGQLVNKIGHKGDDPESYVAFGGSYIEDSIVYIQDHRKYKFVQYDVEGNFIKSTPIIDHLPIRDFVVNSSGILSYYVKGFNEPNSGVYLIDKNNGISDRLIKPEKDYLLNIYVQQHFCNINDDLYGIVDYNTGKIYHTDGRDYSVAYTFSVSKEVPESTKYKYAELVDDDEYYNKYLHYIESDNYLIIMAGETQNREVTTVYNKKTKRAISGSWKPGDGIIEDDLGHGVWFNYPSCYDNKLFVQLWDDESDLYKIEIVYLK